MVGIFPDKGSITRLMSAVLPEHNDEWHWQHRDMQVEARADIQVLPVEAEQTSLATLAH